MKRRLSCSEACVSVTLLLMYLPVCVQAEQASRFSSIRQIPLTQFERNEAAPASVCAPLAAKPPVLDGVLDDECWREAGIAAPFLKCDDSIAMDIPADVPTEVLACRDAQAFYLGWKLTGEPARKLAEGFKTGGKHNYRLARALAILQPLGVDNWYGFYFNPDGGASARSQREVWEYKGEFTLAGKPVPDGAVVEMAIPFSNPGLHAPKENEWWRFQLGRIDNGEWTAWSNSRGTQEIPSRYGYLLFGPADTLKKTPPPIPPKVEFYGESRRYRAERTTTQFITSLQGIPLEGRKMRFELSRVEGTKRAPVADHAIDVLVHPKIAFLFDLRGLEAGQYEMSAHVLDAAAKSLYDAKWSFEVTAEKSEVAAFPADGVRIKVHAQEHVPDGVWPISTGVPLPFGAVQSAQELGLYENEVRVPANLVPRATWLPLGPGTDTGGLRWVGLSFVARYDHGRPRNYVLKKVTPGEAPPKSPLVVTDGKTSMLVRTGPAQLSVNKVAYDGISGAWLDLNRNGGFEPNEQLILPGGGPSIVDEQDRRYDARHRTRNGNTNVAVTIEEQGSARVVIAAKGWYHTDKGEPLCIYHTRIIAYAGLPFFRVKHRTIITYDTRKNKLADSAFVIPTPTAVWGYFGADQSQQAAKIRQEVPHWSSSLHQDRHDHFRMIDEWLGSRGGERAVVREVGKEGRRSDGSVRVHTNRDGRGVSVMLRDVWQKFPKELEINSQGIGLHFWPLHGGDTFADEEELSRKDIHKLYWAHEGKFLDLQIPAKYRERLHEICKTDWFALGESVEVGYGSNGVGTAISNEFIVHLHDPASEAAAPVPALLQQDPHAVPDPAYACATNALERVHHQDKARFGPLERLIEKGYLARTRFFSNTEEWGMWNYADLHTYEKPQYGYPNLHRVWLASHYRNVQTAWLMYFRSGSPDWLAWARAYGDHFMNVDMCHYDDPANPIIGTDPEGKRKLGYVIHMAGAMMHCKGFAHWTSDLNVATHNIDPDAFLWAYYLTGDYASKDAYDLWASAFDRVSLPYAADRETNNTLGALLALYRHTWDPQLLVHIHRMGEVLAGVPFVAHGSGCMWNVFWLDRYYGLTQDDRMIERAKEFLAPGGASPRNGLSYATFSSLCYELTGDKSYISAAVDSAYKTAHAIYLNPDDPYDGWPLLSHLATQNFAYTAMPRWMGAMADAGIELKLGKEACALPFGRPGFRDASNVPSNFELLLVEPEDRDLSLIIELSSRHNTTFRVHNGKGKKVADKTVRAGRHLGDKAVKLAIPNDECTGILRLTGHAYDPPASLPISDLPGEAAVMRRGGAYTVGGAVYHLAPEPGYGGETLLTVGGPSDYRGYGPSIVQITDSQGKVLLDSSIAGELQRHTVRANLDPRQSPPPWKLFVAARVGFQFSGPDKLYVSSSQARLRAVLEAVAGKGGTK